MHWPSCINSYSNLLHSSYTKEFLHSDSQDREKEKEPQNEAKQPNECLPLISESITIPEYISPLLYVHSSIYHSPRSCLKILGTWSTVEVINMSKAFIDPNHTLQQS